MVSDCQRGTLRLGSQFSCLFSVLISQSQEMTTTCLPGRFTIEAKALL